MAASRIPRRLYTFWDNDPPEFISACIGLLDRTAGSEWDLTVLTAESAARELSPPPAVALSPAQLSDWYRLSALSSSGGVYLDASCIALAPPDAWVDRGLDAVQGFAFHPDGETADSWAIAAPAGCPLIKRWRDEFRAALIRGVAEYCAEKEAAGHSTAGLSASLPYLAVLLCFRVARAAHPERAVRLTSATAPGCPLHHLRLADWDPLAAVSALFAASAEELADTPLVKLRACDRECVPPLGAMGRGSWLARQLRPELGSRVDWLLSGTKRAEHLSF
jgi:hypothetical protein